MHRHHDGNAGLMRGANDPRADEWIHIVNVHDIRLFTFEKFGEFTNALTRADGSECYRHFLSA